MVGHGDQWKGATTERVPGIDDRDGGVWTCGVLHLARGCWHGLRVEVFRHGVSLLCIMGRSLRSGLIETEIRWCETDLQEVFTPCEVEGAGLRGEPSALFQQVGNIVRGEGLVD